MSTYVKIKLDDLKNILTERDLVLSAHNDLLKREDKYISEINMLKNKIDNLQDQVNKSSINSNLVGMLR